MLVDVGVVGVLFVVVAVDTVLTVIDYQPQQQASKQVVSTGTTAATTTTTIPIVATTICFVTLLIPADIKCPGSSARFIIPYVSLFRLTRFIVPAHRLHRPD